MLSIWAFRGRDLHIQLIEGHGDSFKSLATGEVISVSIYVFKKILSSKSKFNIIFQQTKCNSQLETS